MSADTFWYFAYGTYMSEAVLCTALAQAAPPGTPIKVCSKRLGYISGYRLTFHAVSAGNPRLGLLNLFPAAPARVFADGGAQVPQPPAPSAEGQRVFGALLELPAALRPFLLEAVGREGAFNVQAQLPARAPAIDGSVASEDVIDAVVVAAIDLDLAERTLEVSGLHALWTPLPPLSSSWAHLMTHVPDQNTEASGDAPAVRSGTKRWPGTHWCNWIASDRLAPSADYLDLLRRAAAGVGLPTKVPAAYLRAYAGIYTATIAGGAVTTRDVQHDVAEQRTWYLAYGSNMSWEQLCVRLGPPYKRRLARLDDYYLVANKTSPKAEYASFGYYNVEPVAQRRQKVDEGLASPTVTMPPYVCGIAYEIACAQLEMMDSFEPGYHRELLRCADISPTQSSADAALDCWVYIADETSESLLPSKEYLARVTEGSDLLPAEYVEGILTTPTNPQRSPRQDRRLRKEL